jgi:hypothetical protein
VPPGSGLEVGAWGLGLGVWERARLSATPGRAASR